MPSRNNLFAVILVSLLATGCMGLPAKVTTVKLLPPADLMQDCLKTPVVIAKNKDLAKAYQLRDADLDLCNINMRALRTWSEDGTTLGPDSNAAADKP